MTERKMPETEKRGSLSQRGDFVLDSDDRKRYNDMLELPHHVSRTHPHMSRHDRAAQFAPFAALSGHKEAVAETERVTEAFAVLDESRKEELDGRFALILAGMEKPLSERPLVEITYFKADEKKAGGEYRTAVGRVRKVDGTGRGLVMESGEFIRAEDVADIVLPGGRI